MIELRATGLIYRDSTLHAWHPTLALLPNGDLLAAYDLGETIGALDYCTYLARSTDGGRSWSEPVAFFADSVAATARRTVRISTLADGTLIGAGRRSYCHHPETSGWNPQTYGVEQGDWFVLRSRDGTHWQGPQAIEPPLAGPYEVCHAFVETWDGRLLLPTGLLRTWEGDAPDGLKALALVSGDQGQTWPEYIELFADPQGEVIYHEVSLVELEAGRLLAVAWPFNSVVGQTVMKVPYAIAPDGRTFSVRGSTGIAGETTKLLHLGGDRILCLMRRTDAAGLWAVLAQIRGDEWVHLAEVPLWQGAASRMQGERDAATELAELHFGFPNLLRLPDGDVLAAFWCREDHIHNIRWLRISVADH